MKNLFVLTTIILFLGLPTANCQLPTKDSLHAALDTFHDRQLEAQLAEFDASKKGNWLYYLPSVGISYTPIARTRTDGNLELNSEPRPTVSFSLGQVLTARRRQRDNPRQTRKHRGQRGLGTRKSPPRTRPPASTPCPSLIGTGNHASCLGH